MFLELFETPFGFEGCFVSSLGPGSACCMCTAPYIFKARGLICQTDNFAFTSTSLTNQCGSVVVLEQGRTIGTSMSDSRQGQKFCRLRSF